MHKVLGPAITIIESNILTLILKNMFPIMTARMDVYTEESTNGVFLFIQFLFDSEIKKVFLCLIIIFYFFCNILQIYLLTLAGP